MSQEEIAGYIVLAVLVTWLYKLLLERSDYDRWNVQSIIYNRECGQECYDDSSYYYLLLL